MVRLKYNLDEIPSGDRSAMYCTNCGQMVVPYFVTHCGKCGRELIHSSLYEWKLADALRIELKKKTDEYSIEQQFPLPTPNGSLYHWDIFVWVDGPSSNSGCGYLIEVNGSEHYTNYGREKDTKKQRYALRLLRPGMAFREVKNEDCSTDRVRKTAKKIVKELIDRANYG